MLGELQAAENLVRTGAAKSSAEGVAALQGTTVASKIPLMAKLAAIEMGTEFGRTALQDLLGDDDPTTYTTEEASVDALSTIGKRTAQGAVVGNVGGAVIGAAIGTVEATAGFFGATEQAKEAKRQQERMWKDYLNRSEQHRVGESQRLKQLKRQTFSQLGALDTIEMNKNRFLSQLQPLASSSGNLASKIADAEVTEARAAQSGVIESVDRTVSTIDMARSVLGDHIKGVSEDAFDQARARDEAYAAFWSEQNA